MPHHEVHSTKVPAPAPPAPAPAPRRRLVGPMMRSLVLLTAAATAVLAIVARLPNPHPTLDMWIPPFVRPASRKHAAVPYARSNESSAGWPTLQDEHGPPLPVYTQEQMHAVQGYTVFGMGIDDITGPIVQTNMMGYATLEQFNQGIHMRSWARAYIVGSATSLPSSSSSSPTTEQVPSHTTTTTTTDPASDPGGLDPLDGAPDRWVLLNADICMGDTAIRRALIAKLRNSYPGLYGELNVAFVGTHNHAGMGGFHNVLLPTVTNLGISRQNFDAIVEGAYRAVLRAHQDFEARRSRIVDLATQPKTNKQQDDGDDAHQQLNRLQLAFGNTTLREAHINRSPIAYEANPEWEKQWWGSNQDDEFSLVRFRDTTGEVPGFVSWYAIHGTSLKPNNTFTSSDNKGMAAFLMEQRMAERNALARGLTPAEAAAQALELAPGTSPFVAGFCQASVGDTSPNTLGSFCEGSNLPCDYRTSTCPVSVLGITTRNTTTICHSRGPGHGDEAARARSPTGGYDWRSNEIIGAMQADAAQSILDRPDSLEGPEAWIPIQGPTKVAKWTVDMSNYSFVLPNGTRVSTRPASLGFAFAGGTTDGPGQFDFRQGHTIRDRANPLWKLLRPFVHEPSRQQKTDHEPKHILFDTGALTKPYAWSPSAVETQIFRTGNLFVLVVPGEFTTMAGRRLKAAVRAAIKAHPTLLPPSQEPIVVLCGPANTYSHYITTSEEYAVQRYEGGATVFGPWTLAAYTDIYARVLVPLLAPSHSEPVPRGWMVSINIGRAHSFMPRVFFDRAGGSRQFGDVLEQPRATYTLSPSPTTGLAPVGTHVNDANVTVSFVGANPRNDVRLGQSHFVVQKFEPAPNTSLQGSHTPLSTDFNSGPGEYNGTRGWWQTVRTDAHHTTTMRWIPTNLLTGTSRVDIGWAIEPHTPPGGYRIVYFGAAKTLSGQITLFNGTSRTFVLV